MRIPRFRISLRALMLLVVVAAGLCWLEVRRRRFERLAHDHMSRKSLYLEGDLVRGLKGFDFRGRPTTDWESDLHRRLAAKYWRAAKRPWLPVALDPCREEFQAEFRAERLRRAEAGTLITPFPGPAPSSELPPTPMPAPGVIPIWEPPPSNRSPEKEP